mgnify:CR=1 FL=1
MDEGCRPEESAGKWTPSVQAFIERFMKSEAGAHASPENIVIDAFGDGESVQMADELLALVTTGAVESRQDALDYLTWTFMYRRLPR